jgi:Pectate lyase superfamily protein
MNGGFIMSGSKFDRNEMYHNLTDPTPKMVQGLVGLTKEVQEIKEATNGVPFKDLATKEEVKVVSDNLGNVVKKQNWVNVMDFGAKCDGVTDDTVAFTEAIRSANNGLVEGTKVWKRVVYIPSNMLIKSPEKIQVDASTIAFHGNSRTNSNIIFTEKTGGLLFTRSTGAHLFELEIKNLRLDGSGVTDTLLTVDKFANLYFTDVFFTGWSNDGYAMDLNTGSLVYFDKLTIDGGTPTDETNTYTKSGIRLNNVSFIECKSFNSWNLKRLFNLVTPCFNLLYKDSWTEYVKCIVEVNPESTSFLNNKITIEGGTFTNGVAMTDYSMVNYVTDGTHNLFGNQINVLNAQVYLNSTNTLLNNSFINIPNMASGSNIYISVDNTNINGWNFGTSDYFLKLNDTMGALAGYISFTEYILRAGGQVSPLSKCSNYGSVYNKVKGQHASHPVFRQGVKLADLNGNEGRMYYDAGNYYAFYADGVRPLPKQVDVAALTEDVRGRGVNVLYPKAPLVGAIGNGTTDDGSKLAAIVQTLKSGDILYFPSGKDFVTTTTVTIPVGVHVVMDSPLTYKGTGQALVIGQSGSSNNRVNLKLDVVKETQSDWTSEDVIGIKLINTIASSIDIVRAQGFTIGVQCIGSGGGFVYNEISLGDISNNKIGVDCTNETSGGIGWCNENQFIGGRFWCGSSTNLTKSRYGVRITSKDGTYVVNNNNNFLKPSFELKTPNTGEAIPVLVEQGEQNAFKECRNESNSATFARVSNNSTENTFTTGYGFVTVEDNSNFPASFTSSRRDESIDNMNKLIFNSGNLREKTVPYDGSTTFNVAGMFIGNSGNASTNKALTGITMNTNSITVSSSRAIGIRIPTSSAKRFVVRRDVNPSNAGRISIRCFDANSSLLYSTSTAYVKGKSNRAPVANSAFGGVYRMGAVSQQDFFFAVSDEVKFVDVLFSEGEISSMSIYTDAANLSTPFNPVTDEKESLALTAPTIGGWKKGKRLYNDDLFPGGYLGWVCTQSGEFGTATEPTFNPFGLISE